MKPVILFIRHGQTDWNAEMRFQGQVDIPLNPMGRRQAERNGARLVQMLEEPRSFDYVASPLGRARETMAIIRSELGLDPSGYRTDDRLMEIAYGDFQGLTVDETRRIYPTLHEARSRDKWNFVPPGFSAESYAMQARRFAPWLEEVRQPTICVAHGGILRCVLVLVGGWSNEDAGRFEVPQDRILRVEKDMLEWI